MRRKPFFVPQASHTRRGELGLATPWCRSDPDTLWPAIGNGGGRHDGRDDSSTPEHNDSANM
jgi:hypothetical protein